MRIQPVFAASLLAMACASTPYQEPFPSRVVEPGSDAEVKVDQALVIFDASGSIDRDARFPEDKALLEAFVAGMPEGGYDAGAITFGGTRRDTASVSSFDRGRLQSYAKEVRSIGEGTPLHDVLQEAAGDLGRSDGETAIVLFSDGIPTVRGTPIDGERVLEAARALAEERDGRVCFHTVQTGSEGGGDELLRALAEITPCGSHRSAASVSSTDSLHGFQEAIFVSEALPQVAAAPADLDGDGVIDGRDACPGTPRGAAVDERGCWTLPSATFASSSATLSDPDRQRIQQVAGILEQNPEMRVQVEGHTDATGSETFNQSLSEQRAAAARDALVEQGVAPDRVLAKGFGEARPAASNATREGRATNRRIEFTVLD